MPAPLTSSPPPTGTTTTTTVLASPNAAAGVAAGIAKPPVSNTNFESLENAFYAQTPTNQLPPNVASRRAAAAAATAATANITAIKNAMKNKFAGKTRREKAELLKQVLNAVAKGPFISSLSEEAKFQATKPPGDRAKRIATFMNSKEEIELFGGRRRKAQRKSQRKSRKASRKAQRKSRKASHK